MRCLDPYTKEAFKKEYVEKDFPTFQNLNDFVVKRCRIMELTCTSQTDSYSSSETHNPNTNSKHRTALVLTKKPKPLPTGLPTCFLCKEKHYLDHCPKFLALSPNERFEVLKGYRGCRYHLTPSHTTHKCEIEVKCKKCDRQHHTLLHFEQSQTKLINTTPQTEIVAPSNGDRSKPVQEDKTQTLIANSNHKEKEVLLGTVVALIKDSHNKFQPIRLVLDSGSQSSLITEACVERLGLKKKLSQKTLAGIGDILTSSKGTVVCNLKPRQENGTLLSTDAIIVPVITRKVPTTAVPYDIWQQFRLHDLADPKFYEPGAIEFLLGADLYPHVLQGGSKFLENSEVGIIDTVFGWTVCGQYTSSSNMNSVLSCFVINDPIDVILRKFGEIEEPGQAHIKNPEDLSAEESFRKNHYRIDNGQYVVSLPFRGERPNLVSSRSIALKRFFNLEAKLTKDLPLQNDYIQFLEEYERLGHMATACQPGVNIIPHHGVRKEDSSTTKLRVVFDASLKSANGSLNDHLLVGPKLQLDIADILLNFRLHNIAFTADISKMYRQILLNPNDTEYQHIFWRSNPEMDVKEYELRTLTYGLSAAPFLALRVVKQLILDEGANYPKASQALLYIYIDDIVTGSSTLSDAIKLQEEIICLLKRGGFILRKWVSNSKEILSRVPSEDHESPVLLTSKDDFIVKILGLQWDPIKDCFSYKLNIPKITVTKRVILSTIARIYDPLGYLAPVVFFAKGILQETWKSGTSWDEHVPTDIEIKWREFLGQLNHLSSIQIPRFISLVDAAQVFIIGFGDASQVGYAGAVYICKKFKDNTSEVQLVKAKTKLAPLKTMTIPRLELSAALLLSNIYESLQAFLNKINIADVYFFTDSSVVLGWLKTPPHKLQIFVANRVIKILDKTPRVKWCHVKSIANPADLAWRGIQPSLLAQASLWWNGPTWLKDPTSTWPKETLENLIPSNLLPELKPSRVLIGITPLCDIKWFDNYSTFLKLLHIVAYIFRFKYNCQNKSSRKMGTLTVGELRIAEQACLSLIQKSYFIGESNPQDVLKSDRLLPLSPFFDDDGLLRVGGRMKNSNLHDDTKHPVLLPAHCHVTNLIIDYYHKVCLHGGAQLTLAFVRHKYWPLTGRRLVRQRIFKCLRCYRLQVRPKAPIMGNLPLERFESGNPFKNVGVDYAGPFLVRESLRRKAPVTKAYLCLFVCFATKALHLEIVSNLTTEAFIACLERFVARRGLPNKIFSDQGTNFVGAARKLKDLYKLVQEHSHSEKMVNFATSKGIEWVFNPPASPNFGGLWEAGVKSVKHHLARVTDETPFTFEELATLFAKIESILNSRPLCPLSADPNDLEFLTPGHFFVGTSLTAAPQRNWEVTKENRLSRWKVNQKRSQHFWQRWATEYLHQLQQKPKWFKGEWYIPKVGDLVIICDKHQPPLEWSSARVKDLHPLKDAIIRVVTLKTLGGELKRPVSQIVPLIPPDETNISH